MAKAEKWTSSESRRRASLIAKKVHQGKPLTARETLRLAELENKFNRILRRGGLRYNKKTGQHEWCTPQ